MEQIYSFLKGLLIGIANAIPGVSGGTIAVITGIYDRLLGAVAGFFKGGEGGWKQNTLYLLPIALGVGVGLLGFSKILVWSYSVIPTQTSFLFVGLIVGSIPYLLTIANKHGFKPTYLIPALLAFGGLLFLVFSNRAPETEALRSLSLNQGLAFFGAAILGMGAMVVPGISGSFVLLLLGAYSTFITAIAEFNIPLLLVFGLGAVLGLLVISQVLTWLLKKFYGWAYWGILGLVLASVVDVVKRAIQGAALEVSSQNLGGWHWPLAGITLLVGTLAALSLSGSKKDKASTTKSSLAFRLVEKPSFTVLGYGIRTTSTNGQNQKEIPQFWDRANSTGMVDALCGVAQVEGVLGICTNFDPSDASFTYIIGVEEKTPGERPLGAETYSIPSATYAVFPVTGAMPHAIQDAWGKIHQEWFPNSGYEHQGSPDFELYPNFDDERGDPTSPKCYTEIWIPIKPKVRG